MPRQRKRTRAKKGEVSIQSRKNSSGRAYLSLWIPGELCEDGIGQRYALGLPDSPANYAIADRVCRQVQLDIEGGHFIWSKEHYLDQTSEQRKLVAAIPNHQKIWDKYCQANKSRVKATTLAVWDVVSDRIKSAPQDPEALLNYLSQTTTVNRTAQILQWLGTAYRWAIKKQIVTKNPLTHLDIPQHQTEDEANPFSKDEKVKLLAIASDSEWNLFIQFLLLTGCRPSEAVGLTWEQVGTDSIKFDRSITLVKGKPTPSDRSKTNRVRYFPVYDRLKDFLKTCPQSGALVFGGERSPIDYLSFGYWWRTRVKVWKPSTPYSCRDTFICEQILAGVPPAVVAKWCDNSVRQIEQRYFKVLPSEFSPK